MCVYIYYIYNMCVCITCIHANSFQSGPTLCVFVTPGTVTVTHQAPLSMGFSRQEYLGGLPWSTPGDLPDPGIDLASLCLLHWQVGSLPSPLRGKHKGYQGEYKWGKAPYSCGRSESRVFCNQHCTIMEKAEFLPLT